MNEHPFTALLELIEFDQLINHLDSQITESHQKIIALENQLQEASLLSAQVEKRVHDYKKNVDEQELEIKRIGIEEKEKRDRLNSINNYKEMTALQSELVILHAEQEKIEANLLDAWNKLEAAQKESLTAQEAYTVRKNEIDEQIAQTSQEIAKMKEELDAKLEERKLFAPKVPDEWLEKYSIMKARVPNPIVPLQTQCCSACFYAITNQEAVRLRNRAILQCQQCFRLLYSPEAMSRIEDNKTASQETDKKSES